MPWPAGSIPEGAIQVASESATQVIVSTGPIDAGQFTDGNSSVTTTTFDNTAGWPLADISVHALSNPSYGTVPAGSTLELYMRAMSAAGIYGADEPIPAHNATDGFIGGRELLAGYYVWVFAFRGIVLPKSQVRFSVRASIKLHSIDVRIMPRSTVPKA